MRTTMWGKGAKGRSTELHSRIVRARANDCCEACGSTWNVECAHIIPRTFAATRTDERNAFALCSRCHSWFHVHETQWQAFIDKMIGRTAYEELRSKAMRLTKVDWPAELTRLRALAADLGVAA